MNCVIFGTGTDFLNEVLGILHRLSWNPVGFVAGGEEGVPTPAGIEPLDPEAIPDEWIELPAVIPVLTPWLRRSLEAAAREHGFATFPAVIDPTAVIAPDSKVAEGALINAGVVVAATSRVERFATINRTASVGHDNSVGAYASLGPGTTLCGKVTIGEGSFIGASAVLVPGISVGSASVVAAASAVYASVADGSIVRGNPATVVKTGLTERNVRI